MQSSNPVFARSEAFNGRSTAAVSDPSQWQINLDDTATAAPTHTGRGTGRMTIDSVVEKTGITLAVLIAGAAVTWFMLPDLAAGSVDEQNAAFGKAAMFAGLGAIVGLVLSLVNSFKRVISPALVIAYAAFEGVFVGAFSKVLSAYVGDASIVFQAVLGTFIAFGGTLAAYKFFNIQVTDRFRKVVTIAMFSVVGVLLVNMLLSFTGVLDNGGLRGFNTLGLLVSCVLVVVAVFMLIKDFDYVEKGVAAGLPERESWRAAFGLTVTVIWLYIEILRIVAILRGEE